MKCMECKTTPAQDGKTMCLECERRMRMKHQREREAIEQQRRSR
jgi:hypothetical protein